MTYTLEQVQKWQRWNGLIQYISMGMVFVMLFLGEKLPKSTARVVIWYWAAVMLALVLVSFIVSLKAHKIQMKFLAEDLERIKRIRYDRPKQNH